MPRAPSDGGCWRRARAHSELAAALILDVRSGSRSAAGDWQSGRGTPPGPAAAICLLLFAEFPAEASSGRTLRPPLPAVLTSRGSAGADGR